MRLIDELQERMETVDSMFQRQLLKEDIARLEKLREMAVTSSRETFIKDGFSVGWTKGDLRTFELKEPLEAFLGAFFECATSKPATGKEEARLAETWHAFERVRIEILVGCL